MKGRGQQKNNCWEGQHWS